MVNFNLLPAYLLLIAVGWLAGYFVVPMNALLQHRGHVLLSAGHSIAVQNFNEKSLRSDDVDALCLIDLA